MERFLRGHVWIGELETRAKNWKKLLVGAFDFYFHQLNFCLAIWVTALKNYFGGCAKKCKALSATAFYIC
jgi:hypothetical protein